MSIDKNFEPFGVKIRKTPKLPKNLTRGEKNIIFIEAVCVVPEGDLVGQAVVLAHFQKLFILCVYDNPFGTDTAILSIARKNAKTGTIAFILICHLVGPEAVLNSRIVSGARSREQAAEVFNLASKCVQLSPRLSDLIHIIPTAKKLIGKPRNVEYQAISAEGKTAHGKSPILAILDEVGQIRGPQDDFVDAITTAQGAYENPLLIYISTQAANDGDLFSIAIDDAKKNRPEKTVCHLYCADQDAGPLDKNQWKKANPAIGLFRSEKDMRKQAEKAARMPSFENTFRNLNLNQRIDQSTPFVSKSIWDSNGMDAGPILDEYVLYGGLDLSAKTDLTALVLVAEVDGKLKHWTFCWTPADGVRDRSERDREPYDLWVKDGLLLTTQGKTVNYEFVIRDIMDIVGGAELAAIAFDRWRIDVFKKDCEHLGVELPLVEFGQGFKDMAPAVDALEDSLLNSKIEHGGHPVLTMCARNAKVTTDPSGNRKFEKSKSNGRIDALVASAMAIGVMDKEAPDKIPDSPWENEDYEIDI